MTGKKRQRYDHLPQYTSELFDLSLRFYGNFGTGANLQPVLDGSREKKSFIVRYFQGEKLQAALLCNRPDDQAAEIEKTLRAAHVKP